MAAQPRQMQRKFNNANIRAAFNRQAPPQELKSQSPKPLNSMGQPIIRNLETIGGHPLFSSRYTTGPIQSGKPPF